MWCVKYKFGDDRWKTIRRCARLADAVELISVECEMDNAWDITSLYSIVYWANDEEV